MKKTRSECRTILYNYVTGSNQKLEAFTDHEICSAKDYAECLEELDVLLEDMDTDDMRTIVDNIDHEDEFDTYADVFYGERSESHKVEKNSLVVYLDDITGTIGTWFDMEFDVEVPAEAIRHLVEAYRVCAEAYES